MQINTYTEINDDIIIPVLCIGIMDAVVLMVAWALGFLIIILVGMIITKMIVMMLLCVVLLFTVVMFYYARRQYFENQRINVLFDIIDDIAVSSETLVGGVSRWK